MLDILKLYLKKIKLNNNIISIIDAETLRPKVKAFLSVFLPWIKPILINNNKFKINSIIVTILLFKPIKFNMDVIMQNAENKNIIKHTFFK